MNLDKIKVEILSEQHNIGNFSCGIKEIDEFIHTEAIDFQNERLGVTYLFFMKGDWLDL